VYPSSFGFTDYFYSRHEPYHYNSRHHSVGHNLKRKDRSSDNEPTDQLITPNAVPPNQIRASQLEDKSKMADKENSKSDSCNIVLHESKQKFLILYI
jgi:hypothetical protein